MSWRTSDADCVHGSLNPKIATLERQSREDLLWRTDSFPGGYAGPDLLVYGRAGDPCLDGDSWSLPHNVGRTYRIDTICNRVLTGMIVPSNGGRLAAPCRSLSATQFGNLRQKEKRIHDHVTDDCE